MITVCVVGLIIAVPFIIYAIIGTHDFNKSLDEYAKAEQDLNKAIVDYIKFKMDRGDF